MGQHNRQNATFVSKLYSILEFEIFIGWSEDGTYFKISESKAFSENVLPRYFKHSNMNSFIRQLNMYGFYKIYRDYHHSQVCYKHPLFKKGRRDLLKQIVKKKKAANPCVPNNLSCESQSVKIVKITEDRFNKAGQGLLTADEATFAQELNAMNKIVRYMTIKYGYIANQSSVGRSQNLAEEFYGFKKDLSKLLGFEKIDLE
jgi:hypothetical protein